MILKPISSFEHTSKISLRKSRKFEKPLTLLTQLERTLPSQDSEAELVNFHNHEIGAFVFIT